MKALVYGGPRRVAIKEGLDVTAHVGADDVAIVGPSGTIIHPRVRFGEKSIDYRDYVRELAKKRQAVRQVAAERS